jgi:hypothetical protein
VDDQRTGGRPAFYGVDASDGFGVECVGAYSVDGFGGEDYESAGAEEVGGAFDFCG